MPKRLIVCCDGTWVSADKGSDNLPSNVARLCRMIARKGKLASGEVVDQIIYYQTGVATGALNALDSVTQGATGIGLDENVITAYHFLATNYEDGDEISTFGFSRGAYTARSLAGCLTEMGLLKANHLEYFHEVYGHYKAHGDSGAVKHHDHGNEGWPTPSFSQCPKWGRSLDDVDLRAVLQKVIVTVVGVWDTVGALGLPDSSFTSVTGWNDSYKFHDTALNDRIRHAFQVLALDEHRGAFTPTLWYLDPQYGTKCDLRQCWFPGYHGNIGGGTIAGKSDKSAIDEVALAWMCDQVDGLLTFDKESVEKYLLKRGQNNDQGGDWGAGEISDTITMGYKLNVGGGDILRTPGLYHKDMQSKKKRVEGDFATNEIMHPLIRHRMDTMPGKYDPPALKTRRGCRSQTAPAWTYEDQGSTGDGALWKRPEVPETPGMLYGKYPFQREVIIKEYVIKEVPGKLNAQTVMLPTAMRKKLDARNRKELEAGGCIVMT